MSVGRLGVPGGRRSRTTNHRRAARLRGAGIAAVMAAIAVAGTACSSSPATANSTAASGTKNSITFGADFTEPPGQVMVNGQMSGADYEICNALAKQMGLTANWVDISFGTLISALDANRIDAACSSVDITPARQAVVNFVPYRSDSEGAATQYGNPHHVTSPSGLCGLNAAELLGSVYQTVVTQQSALCIKEGKKPINMQTFQTIADSFAQILNGRADVVVGDAPIMQYYVQNQPGKASLAFQGVKPKSVGIAIRKDDPALQKQLEAALQKIIQDGTYARIMGEWHLQAEEMK
jgi:polar amino acid transport system substrate-binding protein